MKKPKVLGRGADMPNENVTERAQTIAGPEICIPYTSGAVGIAKVQVFTSLDSGSHGGIVLRFSIEDDGCSFIPVAVVTDMGVEVHIAGDAESACSITALKGTLAMLPEPSRYKITEF